MLITHRARQAAAHGCHVGQSKAGLAVLDFADANRNATEFVDGPKTVLFVNVVAEQGGYTAGERWFLE